MLSEFVISRVGQALDGFEGRCLQEMMQSLDTSKVTALKWLKSMEREGLVYRTLAHRPGMKGRPRSIYHPTKNLKMFMKHESEQGSEMVSISLTALRRLCRYEKGGMCKAILPKLQRCEASLCPYLKL